MKPKFNKLGEPIRIGSMTVRNRIWMSPMWTQYASVDGEVTQLLIDHYVARARGGVGLIYLEGTAVDPRHAWSEPQLRIDHDRYQPSLHRLIEAVHMYDTAIMCQLHHAGQFCADPVSPSGVPCFDWGSQNYISSRPLTTAEVEEIRDLYIAAAVRAQQAGFDGVGLHGGNGYLLMSFFSPYNNKRTDKYGGPLENRMLLAREIVRGIRRQCGPYFPIVYTHCEDDLKPGGIKPEEAIVFAKALEMDGLSLLDLQVTGTFETFHLAEAPGSLRRQTKGQLDRTGKYKKALHIPVTTRACREYDPVVIDDVLKQGAADMIFIGRQMLADPEYPNKVLGGRLEEIRPCITCNDCLEKVVVQKWNVFCTVNPGVGRGEKEIVRAPSVKKVLVIGGGPGGLEAARVAALRGHQVTLVEKRAALGGNMLIASLPIAKEILGSFLAWEERQCRKLGVKFELNQEITAGEAAKLKPDAVIVATGSTPFVPPIPGIKKPHVVLAEDVLTGKTSVGKKVVVAGGNMVGLETADYILEKGMAEDVTLVEMLELAQGMNPLELLHMFTQVVPKIGLKVFAHIRVEEITDMAVVASGKDWQRYEFEADTVVLALGYCPANGIYEQLKGKVPELYLIGDAKQPRKVEHAVWEARFIASKL